MPGLRNVNGRELKRQAELLGTQKLTEHLTEALEQKKLRPDDFSIRELAEAYMGAEWVANLAPKSGRWYVSHLLEADAVRYSDFSNITGQIVFSKILEGYADEAFVFTPLVPVVQTDIQDMEKIPGLSNVGDEQQVVGEGESYPYVGFSEDYIHVAAKRKRGMIVALTKEAIRGDKTGQLLDRARRLGFYNGLNLEKRVIDAIIDENAGAVSAALGGHRYFWKDTSYASYQTSTPWDNVTTSNGLVDWTDVENALLTLRAITDPYTGEPIVLDARDILVTPQNEMTALRIVNATETRTHAGGYATSGNLHEFSAGNPLNGKGFRVYSSQLLAARAATDTDWWLGDVKRAVNRFVNWEREVEEVGVNHPAAFERDILMQVKVSVKDVVSVVEPRALNESQA
jgi:hypothetical protein